MILLRLFWEYFKVGLFAVGGGMATIPFLYDLSDKTGWFTHAQLADMLAISESTPGAIGINMATYVGYTTAGTPGALVATVGLAMPSVIVILLVSRVLQQFRRSSWVEGAFYGLRPASTAMIASAGMLVVRMVLLDVEGFRMTGNPLDLVRWEALLLAAVVLVLTNWVKTTKKWHPMVFIVVSAVAGAIFRFGGV